MQVSGHSIPATGLAGTPTCMSFDRYVFFSRCAFRSVPVVAPCFHARPEDARLVGSFTQGCIVFVVVDFGNVFRIFFFHNLGSKFGFSSDQRTVTLSSNTRYRFTSWKSECSNFSSHGGMQICILQCDLNHACEQHREQTTYLTTPGEHTPFWRIFSRYVGQSICFFVGSVSSRSTVFVTSCFDVT